MTKIDFKEILTDDEYKVLGNFLSVYVKPVGERTVNYKCNANKNKNIILSVNTYNKNELLEVAKERLKYNRITPIRQEMLNKVVSHINEIL